MPIMTVGTGASLMRGHYHERVLATQPIAYWPLWESAGTVAQCLTSPAMDGVYNSDVSTWPPGPGIGDGNSSPQADGANDCIDIYSLALNTAFNGAECTLMIWGRVSASGVWTDGSFRTIFILYVDVNNSIILRRSNVNNTFTWLREGGGIISSVNQAGFSTTSWFQAAITVSETADEVKAFWNGVQQGATQNGLGAWAGNLNNLLCVLFAQNQAPAIVWSGGGGHAVVWDRALPRATIQDLYMV